MKRILVRGGDQTVNIGDISHTPSLVGLLEKHLPDAEVILWPSTLEWGVESMLRRRFPRMRIVRDAPSAKAKLENPRPNDPTISEAISEADLMLHSSGPGFGKTKDFRRWYEETGKPFGACGVTLFSVMDSEQPHWDKEPVDLLDKASFIFTRETTSLKYLKQLNLSVNYMDFGPDVSFALDLRNEDAADELLEKSGLEPDGFICVIPRLRISPYWEMRPDSKMPPETIAARSSINERYAELDHAKLRHAITRWVREIGLKVLICGEMSYQIPRIRPLVYDPLPEDVKPNVVPMDRYWITDEAASVYRRSRVVISMDCHSPIFANAVGRPGIYVRQPTDTWKGQMYPDLGLGDWKLEIESTDGDDLADLILGIHKNYDASLEKVNSVKAKTTHLFEQMMNVIKEVIDY